MPSAPNQKAAQWSHLAARLIDFTKIWPIAPAVLASVAFVTFSPEEIATNFVSSTWIDLGGN
jgi:hypothetical protein